MLTDKRKKEIFVEIDAALAQGAKKQDLFKLYSPEFSDRDPLAIHLTQYLNPQDRVTHKELEKKYAAALIILGLLTAVYFLPTIIILFVGLFGPQLILYPFLGLMYLAIPAIPWTALLGLSRNPMFSCQIGKVCWIVVILLREDLFFSDGYVPMVGITLKVMIGIGGVVSSILAYKLIKRLYPKHPRHYFNLVLKDKTGSYIFP